MNIKHNYVKLVKENFGYMKLAKEDLKQGLKTKGKKLVQKRLLPHYDGQVFSYGNSKLPKSTLIVNLSSAENCPSRKRGLCEIENKCYARKCERIYPNYKKKNLIVEKWLNSASDKDIEDLVDAYVDEAPEKIKLLRLNEAGDFRDQKQVRQMNRIARHLKKTRGIRTYTYTHRSDLDFSKADSIVVNGSRPDVKGAVREYKCLPRRDYDQMKTGKGEYKCPGNCKLCNACTSNRFKGKIYCREH